MAVLVAALYLWLQIGGNFALNTDLSPYCIKEDLKELSPYAVVTSLESMEKNKNLYYTNFGFPHQLCWQCKNNKMGVLKRLFD